jgi:hypothetical protein
VGLIAHKEDNTRLRTWASPSVFETFPSRAEHQKNLPGALFPKNHRKPVQLSSKITQIVV